MPRDARGLIARFSLDSHRIDVEVQTFCNRAEMTVLVFVRRATLIDRDTGRSYVTLLNTDENLPWYAGKATVSASRIACLQRAADYLQEQAEEKWRRKNLSA